MRRIRRPAHRRDACEPVASNRSEMIRPLEAAIRGDSVRRPCTSTRDGRPAPPPNPLEWGRAFAEPLHPRTSASRRATRLPLSPAWSGTCPRLSTHDPLRPEIHGMPWRPPSGQGRFRYCCAPLIIREFVNISGSRAAIRDPGQPSGTRVARCDRNHTRGRVAGTRANRTVSSSDGGFSWRQFGN
jgi:hypothetical protein